MSEGGRGLVWLFLHPPPELPGWEAGLGVRGWLYRRPGQRRGQGQDIGVWSSAGRFHPPLSPRACFGFPLHLNGARPLPSAPHPHPSSPLQWLKSAPIPLFFVTFHQLPGCLHAAPAPAPAVAPQPSHSVLRSGRPAAVSRAPGAGPGRSVGFCGWPAQF